MAPKKAKIEDEVIETGDANAELDQAIDDLRGVLKADEAGLNDIAGDFGAEFGADAGSDFSTSDTPMGSEFGGGGDFDGGGFGGDFGDSGFGGGDFGTGASMGAVAEPGSALHANLDLIKDIPIDVQIILGTSKMQVSGLMNLTEGAIIALDRKIGEPVDLIVNGRLIGRGEITIMENDETRFGIKLLEVKSSGKS
ncbi:flagellar motor switch protein FliN/FliY [Rhizobium sp. SG_E_25_P2]|jgi:flagellar motor switch protein FliN|uniref:flagellar motor switch protein FliN n=1 Tax=Rhizobium sp. SG_E_25_P2 TaxID=2879942 RepID=UPI002473297E|nr:flagellar motor switch protein FliN [Rhizobium sp. SG_E_25_P2]MDH6266436.1 flagellar motor switch protein FliN/FliY [Rhizobium sp. SG_E_25_P2]